MIVICFPSKLPHFCSWAFNLFSNLSPTLCYSCFPRRCFRGPFCFQYSVYGSVLFYGRAQFETVPCCLSRKSSPKIHFQIVKVVLLVIQSQAVIVSFSGSIKLTVSSLWSLSKVISLSWRRIYWIWNTRARILSCFLYPTMAMAKFSLWPHQRALFLVYLHNLFLFSLVFWLFFPFS